MVFRVAGDKFMIPEYLRDKNISIAVYSLSGKPLFVEKHANYFAKLKSNGGRAAGCYVITVSIIK